MKKTKKMKILLIILAVIVVAFGGFVIWFYTGNNGDEGVEGADNTIEADGKTYYEADYENGNTSESVGSLTYSLPSGFTGINSEDDSVNENLYINQDSGTKLSIRNQSLGSSSKCSKEVKEYLDGASDVEEFQVGSYTAYKFNYKEKKNVVECDFCFAAGSTFYSGFMFHEGDVDDIQEDEPEAITLTDEEIQAFDSLCNSLDFK